MQYKYPWKTAQFEINQNGNDYVAGDIHGEFEHLEQALISLGFNIENDRLFCVGDLIDRGCESERIVEFLNYRWFYSIAGNHEWMLYNCHDDHRSMQEFWFPNGGSWWLSMTPEQKTSIINSIEAQLFATVTIETEYGRIGLVHALVYPFYNWDEFCLKLENDQAVQQWALWQRDFDAFEDKTIVDIDLILCGHTPMSEPYSFSNFFNIDTGCGHQPSHFISQPALTIVELANPQNVHRFNTQND